MAAMYGACKVEAGNWVVCGRGEDRDFGLVVEADSSRIEIAWDSGVRTTIDALSHFVDDDTIEVYQAKDEARSASARQS